MDAVNVAPHTPPPVSGFTCSGGGQLLPRVPTLPWCSFRGLSLAPWELLNPGTGQPRSSRNLITQSNSQPMRTTGKNVSFPMLWLENFETCPIHFLRGPPAGQSVSVYTLYWLFLPCLTSPPRHSASPTSLSQGLLWEEQN